jgi:hypothetical protein
MLHNLDNAFSAFLMSKAGMVTLSIAIIGVFVYAIINAIFQ